MLITSSGRYLSVWWREGKLEQTGCAFLFTGMFTDTFNLDWQLTARGHRIWQSQCRGRRILSRL